MKRLSALLLCVGILAACGGGRATPSVPAEAVAKGWEGVRLQVLCLDVRQSYPEIGADFSLPVEPALRRLLGGLGIRVADRGQACDATLSLSLEGEALELDYNICLGASCGRCYTGAQVSGEMGLTRPGYAPWSHFLSARISPPSYTSSCPKSPQEAPLGKVWPRAVLDGLLEMWGLPALDVGLDDPDDNVREAAVRLLEKQGPEGIPLLIRALQDRSAAVRERAASALGTLGPQANEAVPALIDMLDDSDRSVRMAAAGALRDITGQDFGQDQASWRRWLVEPDYRPTPVTSWRGLPIMPGATSMGEEGSQLHYMVEVGCGEAAAFYQAEMAAAGWTLTKDDPLGPARHLEFEKDGARTRVYLNNAPSLQEQIGCLIQLFVSR